MLMSHAEGLIKISKTGCTEVEGGSAVIDIAGGELRILNKESEKIVRHRVERQIFLRKPLR